MVRNYVRKKPPPPYNKYDLEEAIRVVRSGDLKLYKAAQLYKIPKSTLFTRVKGIRGARSTTGGRAYCLTNDIEERIAAGIKTLEKWGFLLSKQGVLQLIGHYVQANNIKSPFKNEIPGSDYYIRFKNMFNISQKKPQSLDPFIIYAYFNLLKEHNVQNISPSQIYNIDETSFCLDPPRVKVNLKRENITVLFGGNAVGEKLPPLVVFKGNKVCDSWVSKEEYPGTTYSATSHGCMDTGTFQKYFENNLLQNIGSERPVILIYDGHNSHISISLIEKAMENNVVIIKLPPHSSHLLQPMNLRVSKFLHMAWDAELITWQRENYGIKLSKAVLGKIISTIWSQINSAIIIKGFEEAGIYPFNNEVIPIEKFNPQVYTSWSDLENDVTLEPILEEGLAQTKPLDPYVSIRKTKNTKQTSPKQKPSCQAVRKKNIHDEFNAIGTNVATKLRKMNSMQQLLAEGLINKIVMKGMFSELTRLTDITDVSDVPSTSYATNPVSFHRHHDCQEN